jgi:hypothetical protein
MARMNAERAIDLVRADPRGSASSAVLFLFCPGLQFARHVKNPDVSGTEKAGDKTDDGSTTDEARVGLFRLHFLSLRASANFAVAPVRRRLAGSTEDLPRRREEREGTERRRLGHRNLVYAKNEESLAKRGKK